MSSWVFQLVSSHYTRDLCVQSILKRRKNTWDLLDRHVSFLLFGAEVGRARPKQLLHALAGDFPNLSQKCYETGESTKSCDFTIQPQTPPLFRSNPLFSRFRGRFLVGQNRLENSLLLKGLFRGLGGTGKGVCGPGWKSDRKPQFYACTLPPVHA